MSLGFVLIRVPGKAQPIKVFNSPQPVRLFCPTCKWQGVKQTRVPACENQHSCPNGCSIRGGHCKEAAA